MRLFLRFARTYALPYWKWYLLGLIALYGSNQLTVWVPMLLKRGIDALAVRDSASSQEVVALLAACALGIMVIRTLSRACFFNPGRAAEFRLKNHLFTHLLSLQPAFHDRAKVGDLMSRASNDLGNVRILIGFAGLQLVEATIVLPLTFSQMASLDLSLALMTGSVMLLAVSLLWGSAQGVMRLMRQNLEQLAKLSDHILGTWAAIPVVQGFCAEDAFDARFDVSNQHYVRTSLSLSALRAFVIPLVSVCGAISTGLVLYYGGRDVLEGRLTVGAMVAFSGFITLLVSRMVSFGWTLSAIQRGMVSLRRVYELLDTAPGLPVATETLPPEVASPDGAGTGYRLEARSLTFRWPETDRTPALQDLSFTLEPGQTLGIFGQTGAGKSTLVQLLARFYSAPPGTLFLNGVDLTRIPLPDVRRLLAYVPQDPFLFSKSLRENIGWAGGSTIEPERLERAVRLACLEPDLNALAQGLDTVVGARGVTLSGGQRQRSALARALYAPFRILLLDDVVSAVDHRTERALIRNLYEGARQAETDAHGLKALQTSVIVSHRISALQHADQILVLEQGRLVDSGTHAELSARPGLYLECWLKQQSRAVEEGDAAERMVSHVG